MVIFSRSRTGTPSVAFLSNQLKVGRREEARDALMKLDPAVADRELADVEADLAREASEGEASWGEVFSKRLRRPLLIGLGLAVFQQIAGINAIIVLPLLRALHHRVRLGLLPRPRDEGPFAGGDPGAVGTGRVDPGLTSGVVTQIGRRTHGEDVFESASMPIDRATP